jgi:crossover junction endodeoxyribonuclease RuvC
MRSWKAWKDRDVTLLKCIGIDPGLGRLGFASVSREGAVFRALSYGCIETPAGAPLPLRLGMLYERIGEQIELCSPDFMSVEKLFFGRNITTAEYVWQARGVILLLAGRSGLPVVEPKPSQVKLAVCGSGTAPKEQVQKMVSRIMNLDRLPKPDDAADALAAAVAGFFLFAESRRTIMAGGADAAFSFR